MEENSVEKIPVLQGTSDQQIAYDVLMYSLAGAFNATRQGVRGMLVHRRDANTGLVTVGEEFSQSYIMVAAFCGSLFSTGDKSLRLMQMMLWSRRRRRWWRATCRRRTRRGRARRRGRRGRERGCPRHRHWPDLG